MVASLLVGELIWTDDAVSADELGKQSSPAPTVPDRIQDPAFLFARGQRKLVYVDGDENEGPLGRCGDCDSSAVVREMAASTGLGSALADVERNEDS